METGGIEAITVAYNRIKSGEFDAAIIGSISLVLLPEISYHYKELGLISPDGKTKSFDSTGLYPVDLSLTSCTVLNCSHENRKF
jgi:Polyketide synthase modules and related proteins